MSGGFTAGSSRQPRLDPFSLPVRFAASDAAADGRQRDVELHRERVVVRRAVGGMRMALNMPVSNFLGVALQMRPPQDDAPACVSLVLQHRDPSLTLPLFASEEGCDVMAEWRAWAQVLGMPMLVEDEGEVRDAFTQIGALRVGAPCPRRRRRSALRKRRPSILMRREPGRLTAATPVHRGEHEIIARN